MIKSSSLSIPELQELAGKDDTCIFSSEKKIEILVLPQYSNDLNKGIRKALEQLSWEYCDELGGLILGYENIRFIEGSGWLHGTNPYVHVHIIAIFYVFAPDEGLRIQGVVSEVSNKIITFLAYRKYNVVYRINQTLQRLCKDGQKEPVSQLKQLSLKEGDACTLMLDTVGIKDFLPYLVGYPVTEGSKIQQEGGEVPDSPSCPYDSEGLSSNTSKKRVRFSDDQDSETSSDMVNFKTKQESTDTVLDDGEEPEDLPLIETMKTSPNTSYDSCHNSGGDEDKTHSHTAAKHNKKKKNNKKKTVTEVNDSTVDSSSNSLNDYSELSKKELKKLIKSGKLPVPSMGSFEDDVVIKQENIQVTDHDNNNKKKKKKNKSHIMSDDDAEDMVKQKLKQKLDTDEYTEETKPKKKKRKLQSVV